MQLTPPLARTHLQAVFSGNGLMAILAGLIANVLVNTLSLGPVSAAGGWRACCAGSLVRSMHQARLRMGGAHEPSCLAAPTDTSQALVPCTASVATPRTAHPPRHTTSKRACEGRAL